MTEAASDWSRICACVRLVQRRMKMLREMCSLCVFVRPRDEPARENDQTMLITTFY
jgi:hypothetical protein